MSIIKQVGIHTRILSAVVLIICALTFTLGYFGVSIINQFVTKRFYQRIDFMADYLVKNSELGLLVNKKDMLKPFAYQMIDEEDIAGIKILNTKNEVLVDLSSKLEGPYEEIEKRVKTKIVSGLSQGLFLSSVDGDKNEDKFVDIGLVKVIFSTGKIEDLLLGMKKKFIFTASILAIFSSIAFYFISRSIVMPLNSLVSTVKKVSAGNSDVRAKYGETPETNKLAKSFNEMLDSLSDSRKALIAAYEKMAKQESLAELGKFSMMIAHEVKNPLGIIRSSMELLHKDLNIDDDNIAYKYAMEELLRLNDLIESFLMFSRPAKPKFKESDLNSIIYQVILGFEIKYSNSDLKIESVIPKTPCMVEADFDLISRAVSNILKNACEANNEQGKIKIEAHNKTNRWELTIEDEGEGVKEELKTKIFEPFYTQKAKGTGLGLAFVTQVIKAHGGNIRVEDSINGGAVFIITIYLESQELKDN